ncbi:MAG: B12-binding domain-containing radical SAM protein [Thaumarchaeota archaeon]|nr:B12-binding domain-containing radical SAM protein [Nitrososphaerota archaeon]
MKICLVSTLSYADVIGTNNEEVFLRDFYLPLGILAITPIFEKRGHNVEIVDPNIEAYEQRLSHGVALYDHVINRILAVNPDAVGFSTMCDSYHHTIILANKLRQRSNAPIIFGGPQATAVARETLEQFTSVDFILRGEAEAAIPILLDALEGRTSFQNVPNLTFRENMNITGRTVAKETQNPAFHHSTGIVETLPAPLIIDMDTLPIPAFDRYAFLSGKLNSPNIEAGRGCPFACDFCSTALFFQRRYRLKSGLRILEEMKVLEEIFGYGKTFRFIHDMLTVDKKRVTQMCKTLSEAIPIRSWNCSARIDGVTSELLDVMSHSGCSSIYFGIESGSQEMQQKMKKRLDLEYLLPRVEEARALGMEVTLSFIAGFPDETLEDLEETLKMIFKTIRLHGSSVEIQMHLLAPYVGTELYEKYEHSLCLDGYFSDQTGQPINDVDLEMIRDNPKLFSNFFYVPTKNYKRELLFGLDSFVYILLKDYPLTLLALFSMINSPLKIYLDWQNIALHDCEPRNLAFINVERTVVQKSFTLLLEKYLMNFHHPISQIISEIKRYEDLVISVWEETKNDSDETVLSQFPLVRKGIRVASFTISIEDIKSALRKEEKLKSISAHDKYHYVVTREYLRNIKTLAVSPLVGHILNLCNGKHSVDEIILEMQNVHNESAPNVVAKASHDVFNLLHKNNLIIGISSDDEEQRLNIRN